MRRKVIGILHLGLSLLGEKMERLLGQKESEIERLRGLLEAEIEESHARESAYKGDVSCLRRALKELREQATPRVYKAGDAVPQIVLWWAPSHRAGRRGATSAPGMASTAGVPDRPRRPLAPDAPAPAIGGWQMSRFVSACQCGRDCEEDAFFCAACNAAVGRKWKQNTRNKDRPHSRCMPARPAEERATPAPDLRDGKTGRPDQPGQPGQPKARQGEAPGDDCRFALLEVD